MAAARRAGAPGRRRPRAGTESREAALARLYDLDLAEDPGDLDLYLALAARTGGPIIEMAVGTGRLALPLAAAGHDVVGIDDDKAMLARARERLAAQPPDVAGRIRLVQGDMVDAPGDALRAGPGAAPVAGRAGADGAGLVLLALNSILLLSERERQRRVVATMAGLLRPGGLAVVDAWLPSVEDLIRFDGRLSLEWLRTDPSTGREVTKLVAAWYDAPGRHVTLTTIFEEGEAGGPAVRWIRSDAMRLVDADELLAFAADAGLVVEQIAGDYELGPFGPGSERAILVARREA